MKYFRGDPGQTMQRSELTEVRGVAPPAVGLGLEGAKASVEALASLLRRTLGGSVSAWGTENSEVARGASERSAEEGVANCVESS